MNITLNLPIDFVNFIITALNKAPLPKEQTDVVLAEVGKQAQEQVDAVNAKVEKETTKKAKATT